MFHWVAIWLGKGFIYKTQRVFSKAIANKFFVFQTPTLDKKEHWEILFLLKNNTVRANVYNREEESIVDKEQKPMKNFGITKNNDDVNTQGYGFFPAHTL